MMVSVLPRQNSPSCEAAGKRQAASQNAVPTHLNRNDERRPKTHLTLGYATTPPSLTEVGWCQCGEVALEGKARPAAAGSRDVGVVHLERGTDKVVHEIDLRAGQIAKRNRIDQHRCGFSGDYQV